MKFWAIEVKSGQTFDVTLGGRYLRLKQVSLGEIEGETQKSVLLHVIVDGKKILLATLKPRSQPTKLLYSVFDKDFTISHTLRNGSVYFLGSVTGKPIYEPGLLLSDEDSDDDEKEGRAENEENNKVEEATADLRHEQYALKPKTLDDVSEATHTSPTTKECMDIVTRFPGYEEGSLGYLQALRVFLKKPARENFMVPKNPAISMEFLKMMIQKDN